VKTNNNLKRCKKMNIIYILFENNVYDYYTTTLCFLSTALLCKLKEVLY
jgi:hypothetical protein